MDKITEQLLAMESDAQEAMNTMAKENAHLARKAEEELAQKIAQIERNSAEAIRQLGREYEEDTATKIAAIQDEYDYKAKVLESEFLASKDESLKKIIHEVLHGEL